MTNDKHKLRMWWNHVCVKAVLKSESSDWSACWNNNISWTPFHVSITTKSQIWWGRKNSIKTKKKKKKKKSSELEKSINTHNLYIPWLYFTTWQWNVDTHYSFIINIIPLLINMTLPLYSTNFWKFPQLRLSKKQIYGDATGNSPSSEQDHAYEYRTVDKTISIYLQSTSLSVCYQVHPKQLQN